MLPFLLVSAVVPSMLLIWFFHSRDVYPEPQRVVWATFGLGVLTVFPAVIVELIISEGIKHVSNPFVGGTLEGFFCAGMTEEFFKYLVVVFFCMRHREFDEPMDGIVYGAVASLGFATLENIMYVGTGGAGPAILRALSAVPCHACMGAIMGYFVGQAKFRPREKTSLLMKAYFIPMILHGLYDAPLLSAAKVSAIKPVPQGEMAIAGLFILVTLATLIFEIVWALILSGRLRREQQGWHAARWAAYYARQPPPPPPWGYLPAPPQPAYAPQQQQYPQAYPQQQGYPQQPAYQQPTYQQQPYQVPYQHPQYVSSNANRAPAPSTGLSWVMVAAGGIFASGGGFMILGSVAALFMQPAPGAEPVSPAALIFVGIFFGLLPFVVGVFLFFFGLKRLVSASPPPPPQQYVMA